MLKYMLDTNICVVTVKSRPQHFREAQPPPRSTEHQFHQFDGTDLRCRKVSHP